MTTPIQYDTELQPFYEAALERYGGNETLAREAVLDYCVAFGHVEDDAVFAALNVREKK